MFGPRSYSDPIDMTGYRGLRIEAWLQEGVGAGLGGVSVFVSGTRDEADAKKCWVEKGTAIALREGESVVATFEDLGRFARIEAEDADRIRIRVTRLP